MRFVTHERETDSPMESCCKSSKDRSKEKVCTHRRSQLGVMISGKISEEGRSMIRKNGSLVACALHMKH